MTPVSVSRISRSSGAEGRVGRRGGHFTGGTSSPIFPGNFSASKTATLAPPNKIIAVTTVHGSVYEFSPKYISSDFSAEILPSP